VRRRRRYGGLVGVLWNRLLRGVQDI